MLVNRKAKERRSCEVPKSGLKYRRHRRASNKDNRFSYLRLTSYGNDDINKSREINLYEKSLIRAVRL